MPSLSNIPNSRVRRAWRREPHVLAKRTPSVGAFAAQTKHVCRFQLVQHTTTTTLAISGSCYVVDHDELGARIALCEHADVRSQRFDVDVGVENAIGAAGEKTF